MAVTDPMNATFDRVFDDFGLMAVTKNESAIVERERACGLVGIDAEVLGVVIEGMSVVIGVAEDQVGGQGLMGARRAGEQGINDLL